MTMKTTKIVAAKKIQTKISRFPNKKAIMSHLAVIRIVEVTKMAPRKRRQTEEFQ